MLTFMITPSTPDDRIASLIRYADMQEHAREVRDAAGSKGIPGDRVLLELHELEEITVLWSPHDRYAYVNGYLPGVVKSLEIAPGRCGSPQHAVEAWREAGRAGEGSVHRGQAEHRPPGRSRMIAAVCQGEPFVGQPVAGPVELSEFRLLAKAGEVRFTREVAAPERGVFACSRRLYEGWDEDDDFVVVNLDGQLVAMTIEEAFTRHLREHTGIDWAQLFIQN